LLIAHVVLRGMRLINRCVCVSRVLHAPPLGRHARLQRRLALQQQAAQRLQGSVASASARVQRRGRDAPRPSCHASFQRAHATRRGAPAHAGTWRARAAPCPPLSAAWQGSAGPCGLLTSAAAK
jgi:hypothetical protein